MPVRRTRSCLTIALLTALLVTALVYIAIAITAVSVVPYVELAASGEPLVAGFINGGSDLAVVHRREGVAWDVRPASSTRHACAVAGRTLTRSEWTNLLAERTYEPACARP